jgi:hypothetical protein
LYIVCKLCTAKHYSCEENVETRAHRSHTSNICLCISRVLQKGCWQVEVFVSVTHISKFIHIIYIQHIHTAHTYMHHAYMHIHSYIHSTYIQHNHTQHIHAAHTSQHTHSQRATEVIMHSPALLLRRQTRPRGRCSTTTSSRAKIDYGTGTRYALPPPAHLYVSLISLCKCIVTLRCVFSPEGMSEFSPLPPLDLFE